MKFASFRTLDGPNVYISKPVVIGVLQMDPFCERETREFDPLNDRLIAALPGLRDHGCASGAPGAFIERLRTGTYFGHVIEHVALELSHAAGTPANFGKTRVTADPRVYNVIVEAPVAPVMRYLLQLALDLVEHLVTEDAFPAFAARLTEARRLAGRT